MANQAKKIDYLLNYFTGYEFDSQLLEELGLLNEKQYKAFWKAYAEENNVQLTTRYFPFSTKDLKKFIEVRPEFKKAINFLSSSMLPLQIKRLELGVDLDKKEDTNEFLKEIQKASSKSKFKQKKEVRWQTYLSLIAQAIMSLRDEKNFKSDTDILAARKRADYLDTNLRKLLKGIGEYFFLNETIGAVQGDYDGALLTAFTKLSRLFGLSAKPMNKDEIFEREKSILDLTSRAVVWYPTDNIDAKTALFDRFIDLGKNVEDMKILEGYANERDAIEKEKREKRAALIKKAYSCKTYTAMTSSTFFPIMFYNLKMMNNLQLVSLVVTLSLYAALGSEMSKLEEGSGKDGEENTSQSREVNINISEFQIPLYRRQVRKLVSDVCNKMASDGLMNPRFDFNTCYNILETMAPVHFLKLCELDDYFYKVNSGKDVLQERRKYGKKPIEEWTDLQKMDFMVSCICSSIQDLRDEKTPRSLKDAEATQGNMEYILRGVPEYWFNHYRANFSENCKNEAETYCTKILLDDMSGYFNPDASVCVTKEELPRRMSDLKNLAYMAISINPNWSNSEKCELWECVYQMNIPDIPKIIIHAENPQKQNGDEKTHE